MDCNIFFYHCSPSIDFLIKLKDLFLLFLGILLTPLAFIVVRSGENMRLIIRIYDFSCFPYVICITNGNIMRHYRQNYVEEEDEEQENSKEKSPRFFSKHFHFPAI